MELNRKLQLVWMNLSSITTHRDEDAAVRLASVAQVEAMCATARGEINAEVEARIAAAMTPPAEPVAKDPNDATPTDGSFQ